MMMRRCFLLSPEEIKGQFMGDTNKIGQTASQIPLSMRQWKFDNFILGTPSYNNFILSGRFHEPSVIETGWQGYRITQLKQPRICHYLTSFI
jgi:hypothetical protein